MSFQVVGRRLGGRNFTVAEFAFAAATFLILQPMFTIVMLCVGVCASEFQLDYSKNIQTLIVDL